MSRFTDHLWLVAKEVKRVRARRWVISPDDAWQSAAIGLHQADQRAPASMPAAEFERYARWRVRGELVDELRRSVFEARRNFGREHKVPRRTETGAVEMARDAGLLPRVVVQDDGYEVVAMTPSPEDEAATLEALPVAQAAIDALPARARDMLMRRLSGEGDREIAKLHGISAVRVNQIVWEAVRRMNATE